MYVLCILWLLTEAKTLKTFHWQELIVFILSFLKIFGLTKRTTQFFNVKDLQENQEKTLLLVYSG